MKAIDKGIIEEKSTEEHGVEQNIPRWRWVVLGMAMAFCLYTLVRAILRRKAQEILMSFATMALVALPIFMETKLGLVMSGWMYVFSILYAIGPILGTNLHFYFYISWWDTMLHFVGGIVFALAGCYLVVLLHEDCRKMLYVRALFALCFSMAAAAAWEFCEYGCDRIFGMDAQQDTFLPSITSYYLSPETGETGTLVDITKVEINGVDMEWEGYLDIGLIDTMEDMMAESAGALVYALLFLLDKDRHPAFTRRKRGTPCPAVG